MDYSYEALLIKTQTQKLYKMELTPRKTQLLDDLGNDLLADVSISDLMQDVTMKLMVDIEQKRRQVITERLKEIVGIDLNIEEEAKRKFKRLVIEYNGNEETVYFNDGSATGKRIVTFIKKDNPLILETDITQMSIEYSYY